MLEHIVQVIQKFLIAISSHWLEIPGADAAATSASTAITRAGVSYDATIAVAAVAAFTGDHSEKGYVNLICFEFKVNI